MGGFQPGAAASTPKTVVTKSNTAIVNAGLNQVNAQMFGLGAQFTPASTGKVKVLIEGYFTNQTAADKCGAQGSFGIGAPPVANAAAAGTLFGVAAVQCQASAAGQLYLLILEDEITGLTVGTTYWFDVQVWAITGGTAQAGPMTATIYEVS